MRQRGWQQRRGKGSIETTLTASRSGLIWGERQGARANFLERDCACLACLVTPTFPFSPPPYSISTPPSHSRVQFCSILPLSFPPPSHLHSEEPRGNTTFAVFSFNFQLSRSSCVVRLIKGLSLQVRAACSLHTHHTTHIC